MLSKIKNAASKVKTAVGNPGNPAATAPSEATASNSNDPIIIAKRTLQDTIQNVEKAAKDRLDKKQELKLRQEGPKSERWKLFKDKLNFASTPLKKVLGLMFDRKYPISHYIALILIIMLLLGLLSFFAFRRGRRASRRSGKKSMLDRMFPNSYKASLLARSVIGGDIPTEPRDTIIGRCDNVQYKERGGLCENTKLPDPIIWDLQSLEELKSVPQALRDKLTKNDVLLKVFIPWKAMGSFYVPDCSNAYYLNGEKSFLLLDDGFQCNKASFTKMTYQQAMRINKLFSTYKGLDSFE